MSAQNKGLMTMPYGSRIISTHAYPPDGWAFYPVNGKSIYNALSTQCSSLVWTSGFVLVKI